MSVRGLGAFARADRRTMVVAGLVLLGGAVLAGALLAMTAAPVPLAPDARSASGAGDGDGDGVSDLVEVAVWGTDPASADSDGDRLPDAWEVAHAVRDPATGKACPDPAAPDAAWDCRGKGLTLAEDFANRTLPWREDSDGDAIPDAYEATHGMDPATADADRDPFADGLTNVERWRHGARGDRLDTACSGMSDGAKVRAGLEPATASTGGSGVPDGWALHWGLDPRDPGLGAQRLDGDEAGLTVLEKARHSFARHGLCATPQQRAPDFGRGLDPRRADSDGDGLADAWEVAFQLDPTQAGDAGPVRPEVAARAGLGPEDPRRADRAPLPGEDADGDGLSNLEAFLLGACPDKADCDGDGLTTREEALDGWDVTVEGQARRVFSDPLRAVSDGDRIPDAAKRAGSWDLDGRTLRFPALDPATPDTDGDGLPDAREVVLFAGVLDPVRRDTDGDGLADGDEERYWDGRAAAEPARAEALCAGCSIQAGKPPNVANPDSDGDGLRDGDEVAPRPQPVAPGALERAAFPASDPAAGDSDGDGLPDRWERRHARLLAAEGAWDLDPSQQDSFARLAAPGRGCPGHQPCPDGDRDLDEDALPNRLELAADTDPHLPDTDGDGLPDGWEHAHGAAGGARFAPSALEGRGWRWLPKAGEVVPMLPRDPADAARALATLAYARFPPGGIELAPGERIATPPQGALPAKVEGTRTFTVLNAFRAGALPEQPDQDRDGLPDLWEAAWSAAPLGQEGAFTIGDGGDGARDPDEDGLTNVEEFRLGSNPFAADTDGGGLADALERDLGLDLLDARDDAADGDLDGDGLGNRDELQRWRTRVDHPDTDGDALLDGPTLELPAVQGTPAQVALRGRLLDLGIAHRREGSVLRFYGEHEVSTSPERGCARAWSCAGDDLPDAWKVYHGLSPLAFYAPGQSLTSDGLGVLKEYRWGRPADWDEAVHGPWWLGLDPGRADTHGDGVGDDRLAAMDGPGDLDRDGLHDLTGEDPFPFTDRANTGAANPHDRSALFQALLDREAARGMALGAPPRLDPRLVLDADPGPGPGPGLQGTLGKGATALLNGTLHVPPGLSASGVPVVVQFVPAEQAGSADALRSGAANATFGLAFTDASGRFEVPVRIAAAQHATVPPGTRALFGAPAPAEATWQADAARLVLGKAYLVLVASLGVPSGESVLAGAAAFLPGEVRFSSAARFEVQGTPGAAPGEEAVVQLTLTDRAGDAYDQAPPGLVELEVGDRGFAPSQVEGARHTFRVPVPAEAPPSAIAAIARFAGDGALGAGTTAFDLRPRIPVVLTAAAEAPRVGLGEELPITGRLTDARGPPVPGATLTVRLGPAVANATTAADGTYAATLRLPSDTPLGVRPPQVRFEGDPFHPAASAQGPGVAVVARPGFVDVTAELRLGEPGEVRGALRAAGLGVSDPVTGAPPRIALSLGRFATNLTPAPDGAFAARIPASALDRAGPLPLRLSSDATELVESARHEAPVVVHAATRLEVDAPVLVRGVPSEVRGVLRDAAGRPVPEAPVEIRAGGQAGRARTDAAGAFVAVVNLSAEAAVGPLALHAAFPGLAPAYAPTNASLTAQVAAATELSVETERIALDDPRVEGRLRDDTGAPLAGRVLRVSAGNTSYAVPTRADGGFTVALPAAVFAGGPASATFEVPAQGAHAAAHRTILFRAEAATRLTLDPLGFGLAPGAAAIAVARLVTSVDGAPAAGQRLVARLHGTLVGEGVTDANGTAVLRLAVPGAQPIGPAVLAVSFEGADGLRPRSVEVPVRVRQAVVLALEAGPDAPASPTVRVAVHAADRGGAPLAGARVAVDLPGYAVPLVLVTDAEGRAEAVRLRVEGSGQVRARLAGDEDHLSAVAVQTVALSPLAEVPAAAFPVAALGLAAALAAALAGWRFRGWRRNLARELDEAFEQVDREVRAATPNAAHIVRAYLALCDALALRGLLPPGGATPREVEATLVATFALDRADLALVIDAFETARYAPAPLRRDEVEAVARATGRLRRALRQAQPAARGVGG